MSEKSVVKLVVTEKQKELIQAMWAHNGWELELDNEHDEDGAIGDNSSQLDSDSITGFRTSQDESEPECQFCLCRPCITDETNKQLWWETEASPPQESNSVNRKSHYKRFWTMLLHKGVWGDPRYKARKEECLRQEPKRNISAWMGPGRHIRDIMPDCVLKVVREWLPNPLSKPYMGHKWC